MAVLTAESRDGNTFYYVLISVVGFRDAKADKPWFLLLRSSGLEGERTQQWESNFRAGIG